MGRTLTLGAGISLSRVNRQTDRLTVDQYYIIRLYALTFKMCYMFGLIPKPSIGTCKKV